MQVRLEQFAGEVRNASAARLRKFFGSAACALGGLATVLLITQSCLAAETMSGKPLHPGPELVALWARQLLAVFDPAQGNPTQAEILGAVANPAASAALHLQLGRPVSASKMLQFDASPELSAHLAANPRSPRAILERYVLLTYASLEDANLALGILRVDVRVSAVQRNDYFLPSAVPSDTYFSGSAGSPAGSFQWGMQALNFPSAWDVQRGTAYIAALDLGIYCLGSSGIPCTAHWDLRQNFREQFSATFITGDMTGVAEYIHVDPPQEDVTGHGTHVAGIMAATPQYGSFTNGQTDTGVSGACWTCSLAVIKRLNLSQTPGAITFAADHGIQVLNMSFGDDLNPTFSNCGDGTQPAMCTAIAYAVERDVLMTASSGNFYRNRIQFPARHADTIAVGGIQYGGVFWRDGYGSPCTPTGGECGSNYGLQTDGISKQVVAPARDIVSTFHSGYAWNPPVHCGDTYGPNLGGVSSGYGDCTGTSMSSPHIAGLVALMRSANPLLSKNDIKSALLASSAPCPDTDPDSSKCGAGIPDAGKAVRAALGPGAMNRLTPLFSFHSAAGQDHVYTIAPQMALAALNSGLLLPQPTTPIAYLPIGNAVPGYASFPVPASCASPCPAASPPKAMVSVFTSHVDPTDASAELVPLYRMSWCSGTTTCVHVFHVYATSSAEIAQFKSAGYVVDGIEGYIYPSAKSQPARTVKLCRKYSPSSGGDNIIFPGTGAGGETCGNGDGFTSNALGVRIDYTQNAIGTSTNWIGWVHPVTKSQSICSGGIPCAALAVILDD